MALRFDQFGVRRVELDILLWPGFEHGFKQGELSNLYGRLNADDLFESAELRANVGAEFESEHWRYDISTTRIKIQSEAFPSLPALDDQVLWLLSETKAFFTPRRLPYLITDRVLVKGVVPDDQQKDAASLLPRKLLASRLRQGREGHRLMDQLLPGDVRGAGVTLVGDVEPEQQEDSPAEGYHWHASIGPVHSPSRTVTLSAELYFAPPADPPEEAMISERLQLTYRFVNEHVLQLAEQALS